MKLVDAVKVHKELNAMKLMILSEKNTFATKNVKRLSLVKNTSVKLNVVLLRMGKMLMEFIYA